MSTEQQAVPGNAVDQILKHRQMIVQVACSFFEADENALHAANKTTLPWRPRAAVIAYLLSRDTKAAPGVIASYLFCTAKFVGSLLKDVEGAIRMKDHNAKAMINDITDIVIDKLGEDEIVWQGALAGQKTMPHVAKTILDTLHKVTGVSPAEVCSSKRIPPIGAVRYLAVALYLHLDQSITIGDAADLFGTHEVTAKKACTTVLDVLLNGDRSLLFPFLNETLSALKVTDRTLLVTSLEKHLKPLTRGRHRT